MKVLFLDVDGVLNGLYTKEKINDYDFVEDSKVELLKQFVEENDLKIVLASTWRYGWIYKEKILVDENFIVDNKVLKDIIAFDALEEKFLEYGLKFYSKTDMIDEKNRGVEIEDWLKKHDDVEKYVIFDDKNNMKPCGRFLVQTSVVNGLEQKHINKANKLLKE